MIRICKHSPIFYIVYEIKLELLDVYKNDTQLAYNVTLLTSYQKTKAKQNGYRNMQENLSFFRNSGPDIIWENTCRRFVIYKKRDKVCQLRVLHLHHATESLTHICLVNYSILISLTNPFFIYLVPGALFSIFTYFL